VEGRVFGSLEEAEVVFELPFLLSVLQLVVQKPVMLSPITSCS
jgi:hypothetical protein